MAKRINQMDDFKQNLCRNKTFLLDFSFFPHSSIVNSLVPDLHEVAQMALAPFAISEHPKEFQKNSCSGSKCTRSEGSEEKFYGVSVTLQFMLCHL